MKNGVCPKCQGRDLYFIEQASLEDFQNTGKSVPATLASVSIQTGKGFLGPNYTRVDVRHSVYVCEKCSYSEIYAKDVAQLAKLAGSPGSGVRKV